MQRLRIILCISLSLAFIVVASAQDSLLRTLQSEASFHAGKLIKIHGEYPDNDISTIEEFNLSVRLRTPQPSDAISHALPGLSFAYVQFGNPDVLGEAVAAIPTMRFERMRGKSTYGIRAGLGLAWFTNPYDALTNPENLVIGSRLANMSMLRIDHSRIWSNGLGYSIGASFTHCSNSHIAVPNIGANIIAAHAGLIFCSRGKMIPPVITPQHKSVQWGAGLHGVLGFHEAIGSIRPVDGPLYPIYGACAFAMRESGHRAFTLGLAYHYYTSYHDYIISQELFRDGSNARKKAQNLAVFAGYEWRYARFAFIVQVGLNLYNPFLHEINNVWDLPKHSWLNRWTSNKIGYRYYFLRETQTLRPFIQLAVKANGGTADFLETAIGMTFH